MCDNCAALEKKVSVLQADMEFEIKKQKEDHASAKVTLEISLQKEIKKLQEKQSRDRGERD